MSNRTDEDLSVIQYMNQLLLKAIEDNVSDIHLEPYEQQYRIRLRIEGILYEYSLPHINLGTKLVSRLKILSNLDITEKRMPQDGRFKMNTRENQGIDFRVSSCPTLFGEKIVVRVLNPHKTALDIDGLGLESIQKTLFLKALARPQGMILVTGPTGSGKTTTLYTALALLNQTQRNIMTCEDPIEIQMPGINQVNVNAKTGLNFSKLLRSLLRQDPDVMMIGEIRDKETAEIALEASQTGHLVLSTLHTNSALDVFSRLKSLGVSSHNFCRTISFVAAQRLIRKLCPNCKQPDALSETLVKDLKLSKDARVYQAQGCAQCQQGYRGRIAIYEMLEINENTEPGLQDNWDLKQAGLHKLSLGLTSLDEIHRVLKL